MFLEQDDDGCARARARVYGVQRRGDSSRGLTPIPRLTANGSTAAFCARGVLREVPLAKKKPKQNEKDEKEYGRLLQ